jgi:carbamoyltransferase
MRERINTLVKRRESFQPFAPAVLAEHARRHFDLDHALPFMTETCRVVSDLDLPAVTHVDRSARVQTVEDRPGCRFAGLLRAFHRRTGCPMLLNTSFNVRGEPIVCTPEDAFRCFAYAPIDVLVLEDPCWSGARCPSTGAGWPRGAPPRTRPAPPTPTPPAASTRSCSHSRR